MNDAVLDTSVTPRNVTRPGETHRMSANGGQRYNVILFDLDGTLTDSKPGITRSVQHALAGMGIDVPDAEALTPFVGPPLAESFARYYGFDADQSRQAITIYRERFASIGLYENAIYPGVPELLADLRLSGATLAIASSKPMVYVERILAHFGLAERFLAVAGSNLDGTRIAKQEVIAHALSLLPGIDRTRAIMVGDREHDVHGAREHGIETVAVRYGYALPGELIAAAPLAIADSVDHLHSMLLAEWKDPGQEPDRGR